MASSKRHPFRLQPWAANTLPGEHSTIGSRATRRSALWQVQRFGARGALGYTTSSIFFDEHQEWVV